MLCWVLPDDMVMEILARLPVRSLVRFKCVAKSWSTLCREPSFIKKQVTTSSKSPPHLLVYYPYKSLLSRVCDCVAPPMLELNKHFKRHNIANQIQILGPCNGIFCLVGPFRGCQGCNLTRGYEIVLWNPATGETKHLPEVMPRQTHWYDYYTNFGFGIDPNTNDFKLVKVFELGPISRYDTRPIRRLEVIVEVYNSSTDSWRQIPTSLEPLIGNRLENGRCSLNGVQYWLTDCIDDHIRMLSFHFGDQVFRWISLPPSPEFANIAVYNGSLLCITQLLSDESSCCVWVMDDKADNVSWTKLFQVMNCENRIPNFLTVWEDHLIFEDTIFRERRFRLAYERVRSYNLRSQKWTTILVNDHVHCSDAFSYRETLVGING